MRILQMVKWVLSIVPEIANIIVMLEKTIPRSKVGTEKLAALRGILLASYEGIDLVWGSIEKIVKVLVALWNKCGWPVEEEAPQPPASSD